MLFDLSVFGFLLQSTDGRRDAYRAIVQARPPHLNNIYLATQVKKTFLFGYTFKTA